MPPSRRKKWSEAEERTLIDKYGEMVSDGTLAKMKTREKKYKPISLFVNSVYNARDPLAFPWQWSWKDVCTKVQNMRHQYSLVKQKVKKLDSVGEEEDDFDWVEGLTYWSNFLRYKDVFGDVTYTDLGVAVGGSHGENGGGFGHGMEFGHFGQAGDGDFVGGIDGVENGVMALEFDYDGEEGGENYNGGNEDNNQLKEDVDNGFVYEGIEPMGSDTRKKRKVVKGLEKRVWGFVTSQLEQLREMETRFEQRELEREQVRQRRDQLRMESEKEYERKWEEKEKEREDREEVREKMRRQRIRECEAIEKEKEKEKEERGRRRREEELMHEREWEERINRRSEWKMRINVMLSQHRAEMGQMQSRILHEQHNLTNQLLGIVSLWTGHSVGLADHATASNHYLSQMMQNLHHVTGIVQDDSRVGGDNQDDQFIVDG